MGNRNYGRIFSSHPYAIISFSRHDAGAILLGAQRDGERLKGGDGEVKVKMPSALGARVGFLAENRFT